MVPHVSAAHLGEHAAPSMQQQTSCLTHAQMHIPMSCQSPGMHSNSQLFPPGQGPGCFLSPLHHHLTDFAISFACVFALLCCVVSGCAAVCAQGAGMVVHPAPGHATGTLVNAFLHHCGLPSVPLEAPSASDESSGMSPQLAVCCSGCVCPGCHTL